VEATQVVHESNVVNAGEMIDRGDTAKAKDREEKRKRVDSQCTSISMPRKKVSRIHFSLLSMFSYVLTYVLL
jgi:hypothetical protein